MCHRCVTVAETGGTMKSEIAGTAFYLLSLICATLYYFAPEFLGLVIVFSIQTIVEAIRK